jgi:hypothetical protein
VLVGDFLFSPHFSVYIFSQKEKIISAAFIESHGGEK